jgi:tetratricopeptide (TPR) repeat protein
MERKDAVFKRIKHWLRDTADTLPSPSPGAGETQYPAVRGLDKYRAGLGHFQSGDYSAAEREFSAAIDCRSDFVEAHFYLGLTYRRQREAESAREELMIALAIKPDFAPAWLYLGDFAFEDGRLDEAADHFCSVLQVRPDEAKAHNGLGKIHEKRKQYREAAACYRKAIELDPSFALAHCNLAYVIFRETLDAKSALVHARKAEALKPQLADVQSTLAMLLQHEGRYEESILACNRALAIEPEFPRARMVRGLAKLTLGDFESGWRDYEYRRLTIPLLQIRKLPYPEWNGSLLSGKRVLIYCEQGIGDEVLFSSCLPDVMALGAECTVECSVKLERLFRHSFPAATFLIADQTKADVSHVTSLPAFDWQIAAGSLPLRFRSRRDDFPQHRGYLRAEQARVNYWKDRLIALGAGMKIGLSWRGGMHSTNRAGRSIDLESMLPLMRIPGAQFVNLQYSDCLEEMDRVQKAHSVVLHHWQEAIDDYAETAALVSALDLIVSVQTAVVDLAGALGRPVWVMVSSTPEWRYLADGSRMPWYPSARLFRQERGAGWDAIVLEIAKSLMHECELVNCYGKSTDAVRK